MLLRGPRTTFFFFLENDWNINSELVLLFSLVSLEKRFLLREDVVDEDASFSGLGRQAYMASSITIRAILTFFFLDWVILIHAFIVDSRYYYLFLLTFHGRGLILSDFSFLVM